MFEQPLGDERDQDPQLAALTALEAQAAVLFVAQCDALLAVLRTTPTSDPGGTGRVDRRSHGLGPVSRSV